MTEQATAVQPGPAPEQAVEQTVSFHDFTPAERAEYLKTLKMPERKPEAQPKTEESAPPEQPDQAAAEPEQQAESAPEPAPEKKPQEKGEAHDGTPAPQRIKQLLAEKRNLEKRVQELESAAKQPTKQEPAPAARVQPKPPEEPKKPDIEDFKLADGNYDWRKFDEAKDAWAIEMSKYQADQAVTRYRQAQLQEEINRNVNAQIAVARKTYEDYDAVAIPFGNELIKGTDENRINPGVSHALSDSPHMAAIMYVIGKSPEDAKAFLELAQQNPARAIKKLGIYEHLIDEELKKARAESAPKPEAEVQKPPAKQVTAVPPPLEDIGGKVQKAADPLEIALKNGDVQAYRRELNRQMRSRAGR